MITKLKEWATEAINVFNPISLENDMGYYQQSPLIVFEDTKINQIENLVIGFNPGSTGFAHIHTPESFLAGNENWKEHLKWRYFNYAHYFICGEIEQPNGFDDDKKTVWTNLTPFGTKTKNKVEREIIAKSIPFVVKLIEILKPRKIFLLGQDSFDYLQKYSDAEIIREKIIKDRETNRILEIGTIDDIHAIQLPHPSDRNWGFHKLFMPIFTKIWYTTVCEHHKNPNIDIAKKMREQLTRLEPAE